MTQDLNKEILKALKEIGRPASTKEIAEKIGVKTSKISCRVAPLRKKGLLESPEKGKWTLTEEGKKEAG
jgi:Mn-dependent DtxR family transcriptional regulator